MERRLQVRTAVAAAFERVRGVVLDAPGELVAGADAARPTSRSRVVTLWAEWTAGVGATHDVLLELDPPIVGADEVRVPVRWRPVSHRRLLPPFEGELRLTRGTDRVTITLEGGYQPPLGPVGAFGDGAIGHRLARSTAGHLVDDVAARIERRLGEAVPAGPLPAPYPPDLRDLSSTA